MKRSSRARGRPANPALIRARRAQILEAAGAFFAKHGYADADLEVLARQLDIGKGTLYRYFPSKERLFLAALASGLDGMHAAVASACEGIEDGIARIRAAVEAYLGYFAAHQDLIELMMLERATVAGRGAPTYFAMRERYLLPWRRLNQELMRTGRLRRMDPASISTFLGNLLYGTLLTHHFTGRSANLHAQAGVLLDITLHGILSGPAPSARRRP